MAEEAIINVTVQGTGQGKQTIGELENEIKEASASSKQLSDNLNNGMKEAEKGSVSLKTQLRNLKDELAGLDQGSQEFRDMALQAANLEDTIKDVDAQVRFLSSDTKNLDTAVQAVQGFAGGFQAAQGAAALFGSEQKEIQEALQKVIAVQGIMNGVQQVTNVLQRESILGSRLRIGQLVTWMKASKAAIALQKIQNVVTKAFNVIMRANPIGLIVTAVAALITVFLSLGNNLKMVGNWFVKLGGWVKETIDGFGKWKYVILALLGPIGLLIAAWDFFFGEQAKALSDQQKAEKAAHEKRMAQKVEITKAHKKRLEELKEEREELEKSHQAQNDIFDRDIRRMEAEGKNANLLKEEKIKAALEYEKEQYRIQEDLIASWTKYYEDQFAISGKNREEWKKQMMGQGIDIDAIEAERDKRREEQNARIYEAETDLIGFQTQIRKEAAKEEVEIDKEKNKELLAERKRLEDEAAKLFAERLEVIKRLNQGEKDEFQLKLDVLAEQYAAEQELFKFDLDTKAMLEQEYLDNVAEINRQAEEADLAESKRIAEEKAQARIESINKIEENAMNVLSIAESLNTIVHGKELKRIKEKRSAGEQLTKSEIKRLKQEDRIRKAQALAQITADTARGVSGAIAAGAGLPFPANLGAITAGVAAVLGGVAQAAAILGESVDVGSVNTDVSSVQDVNDNNTPNTDNLSALGFGSSLLNQTPTKVYVTETDITGTQNKVNVIEQQASFG